MMVTGSMNKNDSNEERLSNMTYEEACKMAYKWSYTYFTLDISFSISIVLLDFPVLLKIYLMP